MAGRLRPHAHTCGTSPGWLAVQEAHVPGASIGLGRLAQDESASVRQAATHDLIGRGARSTACQREIWVRAGGLPSGRLSRAPAEERRPWTGPTSERDRGGRQPPLHSVRERVNGRSPPTLKGRSNSSVPVSSCSTVFWNCGIKSFVTRRISANAHGAA